MAITATFLADFEAFVASTKNAENSLKNLEKGGAQLGSTFDTMKGLALNLASAFGVTFSLGAAVAFGRALLDDADALTKLHDKTNISIEGLQAMRIAGDDAGVSLDAMTAAVNMLQKRLGGDDKSVVNALKDLGINIEKFRQLDGAAQMSAISDAIQGMHDPLRVANDLSALFGKGWAEQLPVLKRGFDELKDGTGQMSAMTVKALDDIGDAFGRLYRSSKGNAGEALGIAFDAATMGALSFNQALKEATAAAEKTAPKMAAIVPPGLPADLDALNAAWQEDVARMKAAGEEAKRLAAEFVVTQKTIQMVEQSVKNSRAAGLLGMLADEQKASQATMEAWSRGYDSIEKAQAALADFTAKQTLSSTDYQILKMHEVAQQQIAAYQGDEAHRAQYNATILALADAQAQALVATAQKAADEMTVIYIGAEKQVEAIVEKIKEFSFAGGAMPTPASLSAAAERPGSFLGNTVRTIAQTPGISGIPWQTANQSTVQNIYVTQPFGTPDAIGEAIMARQRALGVRFPGGV